MSSLLMLFVTIFVARVTRGSNVTRDDIDNIYNAESQHMGLIRPTKDLSIWIDEEQVLIRVVTMILR